MRRDRRGCRSSVRGGADEAHRVRGDVRQPRADGPRTQQCDGLAFSQGASRGAAGSGKPLIRCVRSAGVKTTVHRCESLLVCANAHQAAGSHNAHAFRTPFRGRTEATIWRGEFEEKARETKVASPGADKPGAMMHVCTSVLRCLTIEE